MKIDHWLRTFPCTSIVGKLDDGGQEMTGRRTYHWLGLWLIVTGLLLAAFTI